MGTWRLLFAALLLGIAPVAACAIEARLVRMGTGSVAGVYFPVGVSLCRLVNQGRRDHGIRCAAEPSEGSVANIRDLRAGGFDLALAQSDIQGAALRGSGAFAHAGPFGDLRAVMSLHAEALTIVARAGAGIGALQDLPGKRVAIGTPGSGQRALMDVLMAELGWTPETFAATAEIAPEQFAEALCGGSIDAFVFAVGHPALVIQEATNGCDAVLADATGPEVDALIAADPAHFSATIPVGLYRGTSREVRTFGVGATLVTRADLPEDEVHTMVRSIFDDFDTLIGLNPALVTLDRQTMATRGLTAPLHPGAARYYREQGWLP